MLVTELGMVIEDNELQDLKASWPILVTELGIVIEANELQYENA